MVPLQGQVQPELPCPLSCGNLGASKVKIIELPEKYIEAIRAARPIQCTRPCTKCLERKRALYNATCIGILNENCPSLLRGVIRDFVLNDLSTLHHEFDSLKLGDVGKRVARNRDQIGVFTLVD